jgi:hypothetical protein
MAHDSQEGLTLEPGPWGEDAAHWLARALATATIESLRKQWEAGAALYRIKHGAQTVGAFLLRIDSTTKGPQGVIVAAAAELNGVDMMASCLESIESIFVGVASVRFHTQNPAVARKMARHGYAPQELICVKGMA